MPLVSMRPLLDAARLIDRTNAAGGSIRPAFGVPVAEIHLGILGLRAAKIDTDRWLAFSAPVRDALVAYPEVRSAGGGGA